MRFRIAFATNRHGQNFEISLMAECLRRGYHVFWFNFDDVCKKSSILFAPLNVVKKRDPKVIKMDAKGDVNIKQAVKSISIGITNLELMDAIVLKKDPPVDRSILREMRALNRRVFIFNDPQGILKYGSKASLNQFKNIMAPTIFSSNTGVLEKTIKKMKNCVLKTLMNYGGFGIYHIFLKGEEYYMEACNAKKRRINLRKFLKVATNNGKEKVAVVKYLKRVTNGDKRILVLDGCIISAILRRPRNKNGWICNISSGGTVSKTAVTPAEIKIIKLVSQKLRRHNVYFAGIDTLEDDNGKRVLSEINVTNVGAVYNTEKLYNKNISKHIIDWIVERAIKFHNS